MDADGGIFIHRYKVGGKEYRYKKICFVNYCQPLTRFVYKVLKDLGFNPKRANNRVWLYSTKEVVRYMKEVGSSNQRLYNFF